MHPFTDLHCRLRSGGATRATVACTFSPITDAATGMSDESFWTVSLERTPRGVWLIDDHGQG